MLRLLPLIILFFSLNSFSQTIKVSSAGNGRARITSGKLSSVINLSKDISGCFLTFDHTDPKLKKYDVTDFDLIDSVNKKGTIYLVLIGTAGGNCNVQGRCGASEDWTLVWLKLKNNLTVLEKKAVVVQSCYYYSVELESEPAEGKTPFKLVNGQVKVEFSENRYSQDLDYIFHTLTYKRSEPEKGFNIVSEKRERPQN